MLYHGLVFFIRLGHTTVDTSLGAYCLLVRKPLETAADLWLLMLRLEASIINNQSWRRHRCDIAF